MGSIDYFIGALLGIGSIFGALIGVRISKKIPTFYFPPLELYGRGRRYPSLELYKKKYKYRKALVAPPPIFGKKKKKKKGGKKR